MNSSIFAVDKRIQITSYSPFRGMRGTIQCVNAIVDDEKEPFCFYLVALDARREPIWFEHTEVEPLDPVFSVPLRKS